MEHASIAEEGLAHEVLEDQVPVPLDPDPLLADLLLPLRDDMSSALDKPRGREVPPPTPEALRGASHLDRAAQSASSRWIVVFVPPSAVVVWILKIRKSMLS